MLQIAREFDGSVKKPSESDMNFLHGNINHLTNKLNLVDYAASYPGILHVMAISETWLTPLNKSIFRLNSYRETHSVKQNSRGGGITIFGHESICGIAPKVLLDVVPQSLLSNGISFN